MIWNNTAKLSHLDDLKLPKASNSKYPDVSWSLIRNSSTIWWHVNVT